MYVVSRPMVVTTKHHTCPFHERHSGANFPGCTCGGSHSSREKTLDEMTEDEKRHYFAALKGERPDGTPLF